jgi:hypothetical protein
MINILGKKLCALSLIVSAVACADDFDQPWNVNTIGNGVKISVAPFLNHFAVKADELPVVEDVAKKIVEDTLQLADEASAEVVINTQSSDEFDDLWEKMISPIIKKRKEVCAEEDSQNKSLDECPKCLEMNNIIVDFARAFARYEKFVKKNQ